MDNFVSYRNDELPLERNGNVVHTWPAPWYSRVIDGHIQSRLYEVIVNDHKEECSTVEEFYNWIKNKSLFNSISGIVHILLYSIGTESEKDEEQKEGLESEEGWNKILNGLHNFFTILQFLLNYERWFHGIEKQSAWNYIYSRYFMKNHWF